MIKVSYNSFLIISIIVLGLIQWYFLFGKLETNTTLIKINQQNINEVIPAQLAQRDKTISLLMESINTNKNSCMSLHNKLETDR